MRQSFWCPWPESNQHSLRNSILSRARLPIPPQGPSDARRSEVAKPAEDSGRSLAFNPIAASPGGRWSERLPGRSHGKRLDAAGNDDDPAAARPNRQNTPAGSRSPRQRAARGIGPLPQEINVTLDSTASRSHARDNGNPALMAALAITVI